MGHASGCRVGDAIASARNIGLADYFLRDFLGDLPGRCVAVPVLIARTLLSAQAPRLLRKCRSITHHLA
jgi:hypothetical protein